VASPISIIHWL